MFKAWEERLISSGVLVFNYIIFYFIFSLSGLFLCMNPMYGWVYVTISAVCVSMLLGKLFCIYWIDISTIFILYDSLMLFLNCGRNTWKAMRVILSYLFTFRKWLLLLVSSYSYLYRYVPCLLAPGMLEKNIFNQVIKCIGSFTKLFNESWSFYFLFVWNLLCSRSASLISLVPVGFILIDLHLMLRSRVYRLLVVLMEPVLLRWECKFIWRTNWFHHLL